MFLKFNARDLQVLEELPKLKRQLEKMFIEKILPFVKEDKEIDGVSISFEDSYVFQAQTWKISSGSNAFLVFKSGNPSIELTSLYGEAHELIELLEKVANEVSP